MTRIVGVVLVVGSLLGLFAWVIYEDVSQDRTRGEALADAVELERDRTSRLIRLSDDLQGARETIGQMQAQIDALIEQVRSLNVEPVVVVEQDRPDPTTTTTTTQPTMTTTSTTTTTTQPPPPCHGPPPLLCHQGADNATDNQGRTRSGSRGPGRRGPVGLGEPQRR